MTIVYAILIFCLLIFIHEFGHLISAKLTGIKVNEFALGMGPRLFKFRKGETEYGLRLFPIGGYCAMEGEDEESEDPRAFNNKPYWVRAIVLFAGSLMNILLAVLLMIIIIFSLGEPSTTVSEVTENSPAYAAGLENGDKIIEIDGAKVESWSDIGAFIQDAADKAPAADAEVPIQLLVRKADKTEKVIDTSLYTDESGDYKVGIMPKMSHNVGYLGSSVGNGFVAVGSMAKMMYGVLGDLFTGHGNINDLTGPVGIVKAVGETASYGFIYLVQLTALISLNLAVVNLLPLPALDGGRLIFLLINKITGRKVSEAVEGKVHLIGILLLFGLMIYITVIDVNRIFVK